MPAQGGWSATAVANDDGKERELIRRPDRRRRRDRPRLRLAGRVRRRPRRRARARPPGRRSHRRRRRDAGAGRRGLLGGGDAAFPQPRLAPPLARFRRASWRPMPARTSGTPNAARSTSPSIATRPRRFAAATSFTGASGSIPSGSAAASAAGWSRGWRRRFAAASTPGTRQRSIPAGWPAPSSPPSSAAARSVESGAEVVAAERRIRLLAAEHRRRAGARGPGGGARLRRLVGRPTGSRSRRGCRSAR